MTWPTQSSTIGNFVPKLNVGAVRQYVIGLQLPSTFFAKLTSVIVSLKNRLTPFAVAITSAYFFALGRTTLPSVVILSGHASSALAFFYKLASIRDAALSQNLLARQLRSLGFSFWRPVRYCLHPVGNHLSLNFRREFSFFWATRLAQSTPNFHCIFASLLLLTAASTGGFYIGIAIATVGFCFFPAVFALRLIPRRVFDASMEFNYRLNMLASGADFVSYTRLGHALKSLSVRGLGLRTITSVGLSILA